jgi:hypothetical protein
MKQTSLLFFVLLLVPTTEAFAQSHWTARQPQALRGLRSVTLDVVIGWTGARPEDPTKDDEVWTAVAKRLRDAGIDVRKETPGTEPETALQLFYWFSRVNDTLYLSGYLRLMERVVRVRQLAANLWASTWESQIAGWGSSHRIDNVIDQFLDDYRQVNGGKRVRQSTPSNKSGMKDEVKRTF